MCVIHPHIEYSVIKQGVFKSNILTYSFLISSGLLLSQKRKDHAKFKNKDVIHLAFKDKYLGRKLGFPD